MLVSFPGNTLICSPGRPRLWHNSSSPAKAGDPEYFVIIEIFWIPDLVRQGRPVRNDGLKELRHSLVQPGDWR